jgi:hypothetical protein
MLLHPQPARGPMDNHGGNFKALSMNKKHIDGQKADSIARLRIHQANEEQKAAQKYHPVVTRYFVFPEENHRNSYREMLDRIIGEQDGNCS